MSKPEDVNREVPIVKHWVLSEVPGIDGTVHEYLCNFYAAKTRGTYRPKSRSMAVSVDKDAYYITYSDEDIETKFLNDTKEFISKGRYHDYFFVESAIYG